jgi:hypothetical protein
VEVRSSVGSQTPDESCGNRARRCSGDSGLSREWEFTGALQGVASLVVLYAYEIVSPASALADGGGARPWSCRCRGLARAASRAGFPGEFPGSVPALVPFPEILSGSCDGAGSLAGWNRTLFPDVRCSSGVEGRVLIVAQHGAPTLWPGGAPVLYGGSRLVWTGASSAVGWQLSMSSRICRAPEELSVGAQPRLPGRSRRGAR